MGASEYRYALLLAAVALVLVGTTGLYLDSAEVKRTPAASASEFDELASSGNSSCSPDFSDALDSMPEGAFLKGSCCSPMDRHRYDEQLAGLESYQHIPEIPPNPYHIDAAFAKKLKGYYDLALTSEEQAAYDYAVENSHEKGPCCCKCWRWYVYGGLGKHLIREYGFTGEQVAAVWDLSDGCGGNGEHGIEHHME